MELNFLSPKDGYVYSLDERAMVVIDVKSDDRLKNIVLSVKATSYKKDYEKTYQVKKTVMLGVDNFEFFFEDMGLGCYIIEAELKYDDNTITKCVPLAVIEHKSISPANNYNWKLKVTDGANHNFANCEYEGTVPTPGMDRSNNYYGMVDTDKVIDAANSKIDAKTAQYFFENDKYAYAVNSDGSEVIAYKENGGYIDVLAGGGLFNIRDIDEQPAINAGRIIGIVKGENSVTVEYEAQGAEAANANFSTRYDFNENSIRVNAYVKYNGEKALTINRSLLKREFINESLDSYTAYNFDWRYPYNNDYPYRYLDSWTNANTLDSTHRVYTYKRDNVQLKHYNYHATYPKEHVTLFFETSNNVDYTLTYDLVLANRDKTDNIDYISIFEGRNSDYAAGIAPIDNNDDNTSVFIRDTLDLNLNVTNIVKDDIAVSIKYDIRDYYGSVIDAGEFENEGIKSGSSINRKVNIDSAKHGYGMYFVNLMVVSDKFTYREYYPLALLDNYEYKYNPTSPFGISQVLVNRSVPFSDSFSLCNKIGVAVTRGGFIRNEPESHEYCQKVRAKGIRIVANNTTEAQIKEFGQYFTECMSGNEINLPSIFRSKTVEECYDRFMNEFFIPLKEACDKYGKNAMACGVSAGQTEWYDVLYKNGAWDQISKISLHVYGIPYSPECPAMIDNIWSTEGGLIRTKKAIEKYGEKPFQVNEMGYHTSRSKAQVCLRTQADYNIRSYILCLAYGAEHASAYCFYDFSNSGHGAMMTDMEYHFGNFYMPDYYGRVLPKPVAIAYANMTRVLESTEKVTINEQYTKDKVRAFTAKTKEHGDVLVAWTNCSPLPNDIADCENSYENPVERIPTMPWQNQWKRGEWIFVKTEHESVTAIDLMGHKTEYKVRRGAARVELTGAPVFITGAKLD